MSPCCSCTYVCVQWVLSIINTDSSVDTTCSLCAVCEHLSSLLSLQQAQAEQEEEFISNTLLKKINLLKKEKETLALNYEQEEEFLTNDLSRKLTKVRMKKATDQGERWDTTGAHWGCYSLFAH